MSLTAHLQQGRTSLKIQLLLQNLKNVNVALSNVYSGDIEETTLPPILTLNMKNLGQTKVNGIRDKP